ncbi:MAG TPA: hypothetical protein VIE65_13785 [Methylobacter sp.]
MRSKDGYAERHKQGCLLSYDDARRASLSKSTKALWKNDGYRNQVISSKIEVWKRPDYIAKQAAFRDSEYRKERSKEQSDKWKDPQYAAEMAEKSRLQWEDPNRRESTIRNIKKTVGTESYKIRQSSLITEKLKDPVFRAKMREIYASPDRSSKLSIALKKKWEDDEFRKKCSEASVKRWLDDSYRKIVTEAVREAWKNDNYRKIRSQQSRDFWSLEENKRRAAIARSLQSGKKSSIEVATETILSSMGLEFQPQYPVGPYLFDFYIQEKNLYIECQGEYWHSLPDKEARDRSKRTYLSKFDSNASVLYLLEREFMNPSSIIAKIEEAAGIREKKTVEFNLSDVLFREAEKKECSNFLSAFHYSGHGRSGSHYYVSVHNNELAAICKFAPIIRKEVATSMELSPRSVIELDRFCIRPDYQKKNFASWTISRACSDIFRKRPDISAIISFADETFGHTGSIYLAAGWKLMSISPPDYYYVGPDGWILHKKTLYNRAVKMSMTESEYAGKHGYRKSRGKRKKKFALLRPD